jgi:hypothetical protein
MKKNAKVAKDSTMVLVIIRLLPLHITDKEGVLIF